MRVGELWIYPVKSCRGMALECAQGLLEQDAESAWLDLDPAEDTDACHRFWAVPSRTA